MVASYSPAKRTALASHPRSGSTWLRFMLERASGLPCGFEDPGWANVLPHVGEDPSRPTSINKDGLVVKTHSICYGCWADATVKDRLTISGHTKLTMERASKFVGQEYAERIQSKGCCLVFPPGTLESMIRARSRASEETKAALHISCEHTYDQAIILHRDPLDVFRSNYHYRTKVLRARHGASWARENYSFPQERARAYMEFHEKWKTFAERRPALFVRYEDMKADPVQQLKRIFDFLGVEVPASKLACAVEQSTMDKLKEETSKTRGRVKSQDFFGSRGSTEAQEDLSYPTALLDHFQQAGVFELARSLGYSKYTSVEAVSHSAAADATATTASERKVELPPTTSETETGSYYELVEPRQELSAQLHPKQGQLRQQFHLDQATQELVLLGDTDFAVYVGCAAIVALAAFTWRLCRRRAMKWERSA